MSVLILVVDDEPDVELLFRQRFRQDVRARRFAMEFAQSAVAALQRISDIRGAPLILILSDINMPGMSGLELLPKARAARPDVPVESANKQLGTSICVSHDVAARAEGFVGRPIGDLLLKGRSEPIRAFEPLTPMAYAESGTDTYLKAFAAMEAGDPGSISAFAGLVGIRGADQLASFHLKRLLNGVTGTRITLD